MNIIKYIFSIFSPYVDKKEKIVDKFFSKINEKDNKEKIIENLYFLMQKDLVILNLFLEKKYKGYKYLNKKNRKLLYSNKEYIKELFLNFRKNFDIDIKNKIEYLEIINKFLKEKLNYQYEEARNFGELFKYKNTVIGDCNQIVTFYIYLYSLQNNINDLKLRLFDNHVCLNLGEIDLECTKNIFCDYSNKTSKILDIFEIISINLLDIPDKKVKKNDITIKSLLESAKIAFILSSDKEITSKNLEIAYLNLAINYTKKNLYNEALEISKKIQNEELKNNILLSAINYFLKKNNFLKAKKFAKLKNDENIKNNIINNEALYYFKKNNIKKALILFKVANNIKGQISCYEKLFLNLQEKIKTIKTIKKLKTKKKYIKPNE
jgi:hypothetical protein